MSTVLRILGRLMFLVLFVGSGVNKITNPQPTAAYLNACYGPFHSWVQNTVAFQKIVALVPAEVIPHLELAREWLSPQFIQDHSIALITYIGYVLVAASALTLLGFKPAAWSLYIFTIATIVIIHNPFVNPLTFHSEFVSALLNIAIAGIALFISSQPNATGSCKGGKCSVATPTPGPSNEKPKATVSKPSSKGKK